MRVVKLFAAYFAACFGAAYAGFWIIALPSYLLWGRVVVFGAAPRMFLYHWDHPAQYIALVAFFYALVATLWSVFRCRTISPLRRSVEIWIVMIGSLAVASPFGGILYSCHDMAAGFVPYFWERKLMRDIIFGLSCWPLIMALSFPFSYLGVWVGKRITDALDSWYAEKCSLTTKEEK